MSYNFDYDYDLLSQWDAHDLRVILRCVEKDLEEVEEDFLQGNLKKRVLLDLISEKEGGNEISN